MSVEILPFAVWQSGTNENSIPANDNALRSEVLAKGALGIASDEPVDPEERDLYIVGTPWDDFATDDVVIFVEGVWLGFMPFAGWGKTIGSSFYYYEGGTSGWIELEGGGGSGGWDDAVNLSSTAGEVTIDLTSPAGFVVTLDEDVTDLIFDNVPSGKYVVFAVTFVQDGTGGWEITWPAAVQGAPTQPDPASNAITVMSFATWDGGTSIYQAD
jgi:hypothetical protein